MTTERRLARAGFTLTRDYPAPIEEVWIDGVHMSTSVASYEFQPTYDRTRSTHVEHGVFFDQFWADGANREKGSPGPARCLGSAPRLTSEP